MIIEVDNMRLVTSKAGCDDDNSDIHDDDSVSLDAIRLAPSKAGFESDDDDGADQPSRPMLKSLTPVTTTGTSIETPSTTKDRKKQMKRSNSSGSFRGLLERVGSNRSLGASLRSLGSNKSLDDDLGFFDDEKDNYVYDTGYHPDCPPISMKPQLRKKYEVAIVACGCFFNPQYKFKEAEGVKRVVAGFIGGTGGGGKNVPCPTYTEPQDFTQALLVEYNPKKIPYRKILELWHENDTPYDIDDSLTHQSGIFVQNESQKRIALDYLKELEAIKDKQAADDQKRHPDDEDRCSNLSPVVHVRVDETSKRFYMAEERYQDYLQKQKDAERKTFIDWANEDSQSNLFAVVE